MRILNLYAGLGGNSNRWEDSEHEIVNVELDPKIADILRKRKPNQIVLEEDAHEYLFNHYHEFDFIWSSPPCQSHSKMNKFTRHNTIRFPDGKLFEQIIFLNHWFKGKFIVENVIPYYEPYPGYTKMGRHLFWSNFELTIFDVKTPKDFTRATKNTMMEWLNIHYDKNIYYGNNHCPVQILRNCVHPAVGESIMNDLLKSMNTIETKTIQIQNSLF